MSGLLGTFDGAMAGLTAADVEALADETRNRKSRTSQPRNSESQEPTPPRPSAEPSRVSGEQPTIDPRARDVAARLLGRTQPSNDAGAPTPARLVAAVGSAEHTLHAGAAVVIGRADGDLVVPLSVVSRQHCRIEAGAARVTVVDLGSANGTLVERANGDRVHVADAPVELKVGDTIATLRGLRPIARLQPLEATE